MKRTLFVILVILSVYSLPSKSQLMRSYGIKGGLSLANQDWKYIGLPSPFDQAKPRQGYAVGVFIEWLDLPLISILTEVQYIQKGMKWNTNLQVTTEEYPDGMGQMMSFSGETWDNYLSFPLLAKVRYSFPMVSTYFIAGPRFDYFLSNHGSINMSNFKKWSFGGTIGLGFEINSIVPFTLGGEFRYSPDFQDTYATQYLTVQNSSLEFLIVVGF
jgi:hypothetical protein